MNYFNKLNKITVMLAASCLAFNTLADTGKIETLQPQINYEQLVTQRQVVDDLLDQAVVFQKSPARVSDAGFTAKLPSNMESIATLLLQAYELEPYRVDFLFGAANPPSSTTPWPKSPPASSTAPAKSPPLMKPSPGSSSSTK